MPNSRLVGPTLSITFLLLHRTLSFNDIAGQDCAGQQCYKTYKANTCLRISRTNIWI